MLALLLELLTRRVWRRFQIKLKGSGRLSFRTLIVGTSREAGRLAHVLDNPTSGFVPLGYVRGSGPDVSANSLPLLGELEQLQTLIRDHAANCLFVASSALTFEDVSWVAQAARKEGVEVRVSANLPRMLTSRLCFQTVGSTIAISLRPVRLTGRQVMLKRGFDLVVASIGLVLAAPLLAVIALAVRLSSPGPVFFRQQRVTKDSQVFQMHKFRTMRTGADQDLDTSAPFFKLTSDSRLTRVGRLIRRASLDELRQLWDVLVGNMSLVGPRPLPADQVAANVELLRSATRCRPGSPAGGRSTAAAPSAPRPPWPSTASASRTGPSAWTSTSCSRPSGPWPMEAADLVTPDGMPLVWGLRLLEVAGASRVYGPDRWSPPFRALTDEEEARVTEDLRRSGTRVLFVGLGTSKQERWMADHRHLPMVGVGAAFDFLSGRKRQAPRSLQSLGLEWLYRLAQEPRRLWRRYLYRNPRFVALFAAQLLRERQLGRSVHDA